MKVYSDEPVNISTVNESLALAQIDVRPLVEFSTGERCVVIGGDVPGNILAFGIPPNLSSFEEKMLLVGGDLTVEQANLVRQKGILRRPLTGMIEDGAADFIFSVMETARGISNLSIYVDVNLEDIRPIEMAFFIQKLKLLPIKMLWLNEFSEKLVREWY